MYQHNDMNCPKMLSGCVHELVVRARQLASVAQLVRALHRNRRAAGSIPARDLKLHFSQLFLVRSNNCI